MNNGNNGKTKTDFLLEVTNQYSLRELLEQKLAEIVGMVRSVEGNHNLYKEVIKQTEAVLLRLALSKTDSQLAAAQLLGINRNTLRKKIKELNLSG
ncbi:MAG: hypothetical protein HZA78_00135 [Candidatus Schekmanbacteria bacterium]|nr:hypothetical protein [Candidatus Schekmanbacteria bacterium]